jgi:16S rRNA (cytosine1402-N4)-methyltransferase
MDYHNAVLLKETVDGLNINPDGIYVDVTFGGGGHSKEILSRLSPKGKLYAFDQDLDALENTIDDERFLLINENFRYIKRFLRFHGIKQVDGILADLGVSSHQFDVAERGFSIRFDADLDMRMNQKGNLSAFQVVNEYDEANLKRVFLDYGELKIAPALAKTIIEAREVKLIDTTDDLKFVLDKFLPAKFSNKILAQIYQAIRIEVNQEIDALKEFLTQSLEILKPEGRLSVLSYHSLEDRLVKRFMKNGLFEGEPEKDFFGNFSVPFKTIGKMEIPSNEEIKVNNRARSAKLRVAAKAHPDLPKGKEVLKNRY